MYNTVNSQQFKLLVVLFGRSQQIFILTELCGREFGKTSGVRNSRTRLKRDVLLLRLTTSLKMTGIPTGLFDS